MVKQFVRGAVFQRHCPWFVVNGVGYLVCSPVKVQLYIAFLFSTAVEKGVLHWSWLALKKLPMAALNDLSAGEQFGNAAGAGNGFKQVLPVFPAKRAFGFTNGDARFFDIVGCGELFR